MSKKKGSKNGAGSAGTPKTPKLGSSSNLKNRMSKAEAGTRDKATVKRLNMYKTTGPKRNRDGKIIAAAEFQKKAVSGERARIEPNRKWFGNTRTVTQQALQRFQSEMVKVKKDPYQVIMKSSKVPTGLLKESAKTAKVHILQTETFESTFGPKKLRKRPKLSSSNIDEMVEKVYETTTKHEEKVAQLPHDSEERSAQNDYIFGAGQSRRIHAELFKVIDSSDVVVQVLDARDPMGTRSAYIENYLRTEKSHKHLVFVLNKCDLIPTWVTKGWIIQLSSEYPTLAFHASINKSFGKGALINLLRQFARLHADKKQISVGFIGYPNVGKSSIINTLKHKKCCKVAPLAGETKVWQYVALFRRVNLIDCPGIVSNTSDSNADMLCKGVVRLELVPNPSQYIQAVLDKVKPKYLTQAYKVEGWSDGVDFLSLICKKTGKLLKKGEPDLDAVAKMIFNDFQRGRLPYFNIPPNCQKPDSEGVDEVKVDEVARDLEDTMTNLEDTIAGEGDGTSDIPDEKVMAIEVEVPVPDENPPKKRRKLIRTE